MASEGVVTDIGALSALIEYNTAGTYTLTIPTGVSAIIVIGKTATDQIDGVRIVGAVPYSVFDSTIKGMLTAQ